MLRLAALETLLRFSRALASTHEPREILEQLAEASLRVLGAQGAAVLEVEPGGKARVSASRGLPEAAAGLFLESETIGPELGASVLAATGGRFARSHTLPLVCDGGLFGALVLLFEGKRALAGDEARLAGGLADLAAASLAKAFQYQSLRDAYAQLQAAREALAHADKLRALGEMAAGVAHDLKNLLAPVQMQIGLLEESSPGDRRRLDLVVEILRRTLKRGLDTVERLRSFSRQLPEVRYREVLELGPLVDEAVALCRPRANELGLSLVVEHGAPPPVLVEASELVTSLVNLIMNALDALLEQERGNVVVTTRSEGDGAALEVRDDGPGIPPQVRARLFEPFFTTKGATGTGLGLAMVYAFAQRQGGRIDAAAPSAGGAAFTLWLPRAPAPLEDG